MNRFPPTVLGELAGPVEDVWAMSGISEALAVSPP